eukprot:scpid65655/ scgid24786/ 
MVHVARQLVEKSIENDVPRYALFVDLRKAYDSIPRPALWALQQKSGGPPTMLNIIKSLHESMQVKVRVVGDLTSNINVNNGLSQGCTLAPVLFNLYFLAVLDHWRLCVRIQLSSCGTKLGESWLATELPSRVCSISL